jgi:hypothetical protein
VHVIVCVPVPVLSSTFHACLWQHGSICPDDIYVISRDLAWFGAIAIVFLLASASFFLISDGDKPEFALDQVAIGPVWRECSCHPDLQVFLS